MYLFIYLLINEAAHYHTLCYKYALHYKPQLWELHYSAYLGFSVKFSA
jgi:hypothetical protein